MRNDPFNVRPTPAAELVAGLSDEQRKAIRLPQDGKAEVFAFEFDIPPGGNKANKWLVLSVNADGSCRAGVSYHPDEPVARGQLSDDQVTWIMHLAVNEAKLLADLPADEKRKPQEDLLPAQLVKIRIATLEGTSSLSMSRLEMSNRDRPWYQSLRELHMYARKLAVEVHAGGEAAILEIVQSINEELTEQHPELPPFETWHLSSAGPFFGSPAASFRQRRKFFGGYHLTVYATYLGRDHNPPWIRFRVEKAARPASGLADQP